MKLQDNRVRSILNYFNYQLKALYESREVEAMAWIVLEDLFSISRTTFAKDPTMRLTESQIVDIVHTVKALKRNVPVQYATGKAFFRDMTLSVSPAVLIPRPETEELVQWIVDDCKANKVKLLDVCSGSGCIAIACANELVNAHVSALELSEDALLLARENANQQKLQIDFFKADALEWKSDGQWDVIVSNPPYVPFSESDKMAKHVVDHEPSMALFVPDNDPLIFYRKISQMALESLDKKGALYFEIHFDKAPAIEALLKEQGWPLVEVRQDFNNKDRMIKASFSND